MLSFPMRGMYVSSLKNKLRLCEAIFALSRVLFKPLRYDADSWAHYIEFAFVVLRARPMRTLRMLNASKFTAPLTCIKEI